MVVLTVVTAVPMMLIHWDGTQASAQADDIDTLLNVMIALSCFVFSVVMVMLGYCIWKYRAKPGDESDGEPIHGNTRLEIAWTVIPTIIVLFGAVYSAVVLGNIEKKDPNRLPVDVIAQQYKWSFVYHAEDGGIVKSDEMYVPVNRQLDLHLTAVDVLHSFWVQEWRIKRDLVPAGPNGNDIDDHVVVTPDRLGTYSVICTELCGFGHATMSTFVHVVPESEFQSWLTKQEQAQQGGGGPPVPIVPGVSDSGSGETTTTASGS
jgi:cytochrome c oxidase subunit 2